MRNKLFLFLAIQLLASAVCLSNKELTAELNALRPGDHVIKQQIEYVSPGSDGENVFWDFSSLAAREDDYTLFFLCESPDDPTRISGWEHQTRYSYRQTNDSLVMTGYRSRSAWMKYEQPEVQMVFPFAYGDSIKTPFRGEGRFFRDMELFASGYTSVEADARGTLITPANDTLKQTLRVKRVRHYDFVGTEGDAMRLETYLWYAPGYRYPVFETYRSMVVRASACEEDYATAFFFPLAGLEDLAEDAENEKIREAGKQDQDLLLSCSLTPNPVENDCVVSFALSSEAEVLIRLCDLMGNLVLQPNHKEGLPAGEYQRTLSTRHLQTGNYVLSVQANNYVKTLIVLKK